MIQVQPQAHRLLVFLPYALNESFDHTVFNACYNNNPKVHKSCMDLLPF